jgi:peroxiredoxin
VLGRVLPDAVLESTDGSAINPFRAQGICIYVCYPYTGSPGIADPGGWDLIPGAHGSTPQLLAYSRALEAFEALPTRIFGLSFQDVAWQREFVTRNRLRFALLSDVGHCFADAMKLPTFNAGGTSFIKRTTIIARNGRVAGERSAIADPAADAEETLSWLKSLT